MRVATLLLSLHWMPAVADVICSYSRPWSRIDQGERMTLRSFEQCNIAGYVNLRWDVSRFETLESGEVQLSAQFANHGRYKYFEIDGETSDFTALNGNPVYFADEWEGCLDGLCTDAVEFTVYCHDDNENCGGEWFNFGGRLHVRYYVAPLWRPGRAASTSTIPAAAATTASVRVGCRVGVYAATGRAAPCGGVPGLARGDGFRPPIP